LPLSGSNGLSDVFALYLTLQIQDIDPKK